MKKSLKRVVFPTNGRKQMLFLSIKKWQTVTKKLSTNISTASLRYFHPIFIQNNLITPNKSGFKTGDLCINQLISITHKIYKSFDDGYEVRGVFLDISKAFDKVWHQGLHYKLRQNGISGELLNTLFAFIFLNTLFIWKLSVNP